MCPFVSFPKLLKGFLLKFGGKGKIDLHGELSGEYNLVPCLMNIVVRYTKPITDFISDPKNNKYIM
jgi:hypothetical protein